MISLLIPTLPLSTLSIPSRFQSNPPQARREETRRGRDPQFTHTPLPMALALRCPPAATSSRSPFLPSTSPAPAGKVPRRPPASWRCLAYYGDGRFRKNYDHIPKQFREENLKDGRECSVNRGHPVQRNTSIYTFIYPPQSVRLQGQCWPWFDDFQFNELANLWHRSKYSRWHFNFSAHDQVY